MAMVWCQLDACVVPLVRWNVALVGESYEADRARLGPLAGVDPLVPGNIALVAEAYQTHGASVGLLAGVGPLVPHNVALAAEPPGADRASRRRASPLYGSARVAQRRSSG